MPLLPNLMKNGLELLRLKNIFQPQSPTYPEPMGGMGGGMQIPNIPVQSGLPMQQPEFDVTERMKQLYQPETVATDRFNQLAGAMPEYERPGGWRRFGGAALGALTDLGTNFGGNRTNIGGTSVYDEFTGKNRWREDVGKWKEQIQPAYQAANLERQENINARQLAHNTVQGELTMRRDEARNKNTELQNKMRQQRIDLQNYKMRNPNKQIRDVNGTMHVFDPATGKLSNTGVPSDAFSDAEKAELDYKQEQALERIDRAGETRQDISGATGWGQPYAVPQPDGSTKYFERNPRTNETREVNFGPTGGPVQRIGTPGATRPETPQAAKIRKWNNAMELKRKYPGLAPFIKEGNNNTFSITPPSTNMWGGSSGPSQAQFDQMNDYIESNGAQGSGPQVGQETTQPTLPPTQPGGFQSSGPGSGRGGGAGRGQTPQPRFTPEKPPPAPPGWKYVPKKGGGWTPVPG